MFRKIKELQSLVNASRKSLAEAEKKIVQRDNFIFQQEERNKARKNLVEEITQLVYSNNYGRPEIYLNKIRELVHDYQSQN